MKAKRKPKSSGESAAAESAIEQAGEITETGKDSKAAKVKEVKCSVNSDYLNHPKFAKFKKTGVQ